MATDPMNGPMIDDTPPADCPFAPSACPDSGDGLCVCPDCDERIRTRVLVARVHPRADAALVDRLTDAAVKDPAYVSWMAARLAEEMLQALVQDLADEADDAKACVADARDTGLSPNRGVVDYQLGRYHAAEGAGDRVRAILAAIRGGD